MARVILFGGTFNPIHNGHLITAQAARHVLAADRILFIPANSSPHKTVPAPTPPLIPAHPRVTGSPPAAVPSSLAATGSADPPRPPLPAHRLAMLRLAIANNPGLAVSDVELRRPAPSYTIDTVEALLLQHPGDRFALLIGADQLPNLHTWHRVVELLTLIEPAILGRPGSDLDAGLAAVATHLGHPTAGRLCQAILPTPFVDISASDIRRRVAGGLPIRDLVPPAVEEYIARHRLYTASF